MNEYTLKCSTFSLCHNTIERIYARIISLKRVHKINKSQLSNNTKKSHKYHIPAGAAVAVAGAIRKEIYSRNNGVSSLNRSGILK
jgi:hypothetical protein